MVQCREKSILLKYSKTLWNKGRTNFFSVKGQRENILGFWLKHLCKNYSSLLCSTKAATDIM